MYIYIEKFRDTDKKCHKIELQKKKEKKKERKKLWVTECIPISIEMAG